MVCDRVMNHWRRLWQLNLPQHLKLSCDCGRTSSGSNAGSGVKGSSRTTSGSDSCQFGNVLHLWPAHEAERLHSTRVDSMFSSHSRHTGQPILGSTGHSLRLHLSVTHCPFAVSMFDAAGPITIRYWLISHSYIDPCHSLDCMCDCGWTAAMPPRLPSPL